MEKHHGAHTQYICVFILLIFVLFSSIAAAQSRIFKELKLQPSDYLKRSWTEYSLAGDTRYVTIDFSTLLLPRKGSMIRIELGARRKPCILQRTNVVEDVNGVTTWYGRPKQREGFAVLSFLNGKMTGTIVVEGKTYKVRKVTDSGIHALYRENTRKINTHTAGMTRPMPNSIPPQTIA